MKKENPYTKTFIFTLKTKNGVFIEQALVGCGNEESPMPNDYEKDAFWMKILHNKAVEMVNLCVEVNIAEGNELSLPKDYDYAKLKNDYEILKKQYALRGKIMKDWVKKYALPISETFLD